MKNYLLLLFSCLIAVACNDNNTSPNTPPPSISGELWTLSKKLDGGGMAGQQPSSVNYKETYVFAKDGAFLKTRKGQSASGTYVRRDQEWELVYTSNNPLIANCFNNKVEYLQMLENNELELSSAACDGPIYYYTKSSK